jgi:phosphatidylglycerophosphatase C
MSLITAHAAKNKLETLAQTHGAGIVAFDGDGTLWTGDVADDVVHAMLEGRLVKEHALPEFLREARILGYAGSESDPHAVLQFLLAEDRNGRLDHMRTCELIGGMLAGYTEKEFAMLSQRVLTERKLVQRKIAEAWALLEFARALGHEVLVISASPRAIVDAACEVVGLSAKRAGVLLRMDANTFTGDVVRPIPYNEGKVVAVEALGDRKALHAAFGDNRFDIPMLRAAKIAFAVRPKDALRSRFAEVPGIFELTS